MNKSVLLVEDQVKIRDTLRQFLEGLGFDVVEAQNGLDGLSKLSHIDMPDLCVIDHRMPIMDGITLVRNIRESDKYTDMPVILMTTEDAVLVAPKLNRFVETQCLQKPLDFADLEQRVTSLTAMRMTA